MSALNHKALCALAHAWLHRPASRNGPGCLVAVTETTNCINSEIPDALGWRPYRHGHSGSVLVEAKASRADFLADSKKPHRKNPASGMGTYRYFLAPEGLISLDELPERWGLIEANERGRLKVRAGHVFLTYRDEDTWRHERNLEAELSTLAMCLNRVGDPQAVQDRIRDTSNQLSRMATANQKLTERNRTLSAEVWRLRTRVEELEGLLAAIPA